MTVILHVSHKQEPEDVLNIARGFLKENKSVTLQPSNARASKRLLKEIQMQGIEQVDIQSQKIRIQAQEIDNADNSSRTESG